GLPRLIEIFSQEITEAISYELDEIIRAIKKVLQDTPPELAADIMEQGIVMTGGSSLLRNINELVFQETGVVAHIAEDALLCVAKGTGIALDHLDVYKKSITSKR
ncbi:MAG: rod shape-determining protein, partial [Candidatus Sungbacteria bacterium]|nr:rod shape-determining protein [Candidatus Sungbacteria bacterium]